MALVDHEASVEYPYSRDRVFETILEVIPGIPGMTCYSSDKVAGRIVAKAGVSLRSWGENIPISLFSLSPRRTRVSIISTPKTGILFGGALDLGKNRSNIDRILARLSEALDRKAPPDSESEGTGGEVVGDPAIRLGRLKELRDRDLISEAEYEKRRAEILSDL